MSEETPKNSWEPKLNKFQKEFFGVIPRAPEPYEMRCCFGAEGDQKIRCIAVAKWIKRDEPFVGVAYCDVHRPLKHKGSWVVQVPCIKIG